MAESMNPRGARVRLVCISDTHNDDYTGHIPNGDIFIHAGDMTDGGTIEELGIAYEWISALPHKLKISVAGNHDLGLDKKHNVFSPEAMKLFTSEAAKSAGIVYLDRETRRVPIPMSKLADGKEENGPPTITVYGNPTQPDFLKSSYAFTYLPHPSEQAAAAWETAPATHEEAAIWVTHGPPLGRLDWIPIPPLTGCAVQAKAVAKAKPLLVVFGHYHCSHGVEVVSWDKGTDEVAKVDVLVKDGGPCELDFTSPELRFQPGEKTIFVNAAWMTLKKRTVEERYQPVIIDLPLSMLNQAQVGRN